MWGVVALTELLALVVCFRHALATQVTRLVAVRTLAIRLDHEVRLARVRVAERRVALAERELMLRTPPASSASAPLAIPPDLEGWAREESEEWAREDRRERARALYTEAHGDWDRVRAALEGAV